MRDELNQDDGGGYNDALAENYDRSDAADLLASGALDLGSGDDFLDWDIPGTHSSFEADMPEGEGGIDDELEPNEAMIYDSGSPDELAGDDDDWLDDEVGCCSGDELGFSLKGAVKGAVKVGGKVVSNKVTKTVSRPVKAVLRSPYSVKVAGGIAAAYPPAQPVAGAVAVAHTAVKLQDDYNAAKRASAKKVILNTHAAAKAGNTDASRMLSLMAKVKKATKRGIPFEKIRDYAVKHESRLARPKVKVSTCPKALVMPTYQSGFLVTAGASPRVVTGRFAKAG